LSLLKEGVGQKKLKMFSQKVLEKIRLKLFFYKILIVPAQNRALKKIENIAKKSSKVFGENNGKKIVFNSVDARFTTHTYFEGGVAKALQTRGCSTKMLICGQTLNMCTAHFNIRKPKNKWRCKNCTSFSKRFYELTDLPYEIYSDYIDHDNLSNMTNKINEMSLDDCKNFEYKGVNVAFHALTSTIRYFLGGPSNPQEYEKIFKDELINSIITVDVAEKILKIEKPDVIVTSHDCYAPWGGFTDYLMNHKIRVCRWQTGYKYGTIKFDNVKSDNFLKYYKKIRQKKYLDADEEKQLQKFLDERKHGTQAGQIAIYGFREADGEKLEREFSFKKYDKTYLMFPNVPWDASLLNANKGFENVHEWISYTMDLFKEKTNLMLIIKIHPSELSVMESQETVLDFINEKHPDLPDNIKIIPPDTKISPYSLFPFIDVGLVYNGTVGLEMTIDKIPVIVAGDAHYNEKGFTNDVENKKDYEKRLFEKIDIPSEKQVKLAKVYAFYYFIKSFVPRDFVYYNNFLDIGWPIESFDEFKPGNDKYLDHICEFIINEGVFQNW